MVKKIVPDQITDFQRSPAELAAFALYAVCVAGKKGNGPNGAAAKTNRLVALLKRRTGWPAWWHQFDPVVHRLALRTVKMGQYGRIGRFMAQVARSKEARQAIRWPSLDKLELLTGLMGPKSARFFLLHSVPGLTLAALDTHILAWLRDQGVDAPKTTPQSFKRYRALERAFINLVPVDLDPASFDLMLWTARRANQ